MICLFLVIGGYMKIGMFTDAYHPVMNGVVTSIDLFSKSLREKGHEVIIFAPYFPGYNRKEKDVIRLGTVDIPNKAGYRVFVPPFNKKAKKIFKQLDIFHVHHPYIGAYIIKHAKKYNKPLVFTHHTIYEEMSRYFPLEEKTSKNLIKWLITMFCNKCDLIFVPNLQLRNKLRLRKVRKKIDVLPTGVDLSNYDFGRVMIRNEIRKKYGIKPNDKVLVFAGRVAKEKNLSLLLKSYKCLCAKHSDLVLMIVGEGPETSWVKHSIKRLGLKNVVLTGKVKYNDLPFYYSAADVFVFPSYIETQALVIVEAMAAGLPVAAINTRVNRVVIRNNFNGLLANDFNGFVQNIDNVLCDQKLSLRLVRNSKQKVREYDINLLTDKLVRLYLDRLAVKSRIRRLFINWF